MYKILFPLVFAIFCLLTPCLYADGPSSLNTQEPGDIWTEPITGLTFSWIPGGKFNMGQSKKETDYLLEKAGKINYSKYYRDELPAHEVSLDGFWMATTEVTRAQFRQFIDETQYQTDAEKLGKAWIYNEKTQWKWEEKQGFTWKDPGYPQADNHPAVCISWNDAKAFIQWLNKKTGKTFSLPTEAQWEYAARAGTTTMRFWGDIETSACTYANIAGQETGWTPSFPCNDGYVFTAPVGSYKPNNYGLHDMLGNVWEWCEDHFDPTAYLKFKGEKNPLITSGGLYNYQVYRGGSWLNIPRRVRSAYRFRFSPNIRLSNLGFRICIIDT